MESVQQERDSKNDLSDLGFGRAVNRVDLARLLNRDGSFNVVKYGVPPFQSMTLYHALLTTTWPRFFLSVVGLYGASNLFFAMLYALCGPGALSGIDQSDFWVRCLYSFFFSVQTIATIGYGAISPQSVGANIIVTLESVVGLLEIAVVTGIVFARFARPMARIKFSKNAIIAPFLGSRSLQFRMVNLRRSELIEPRVQVLFTLLEREHGRLTRRYHRLKLYIEQVAFFPLYWTVTHIIDEASPLFGKKEQQLRESAAEVLILLSAVDETFAQTVHARSSYRYDEIVCNAKFEDMYINTSDGRPAIDLSKLSLFHVIDETEH